eukprot:GHVR01030866.1.p1 GENE.GHVR01030866.1~~GHVR01030866.1.p1  ORF type:complete len:289 (+),score=81.89 GHVR01030866.1:44-910(+)
MVILHVKRPTDKNTFLFETTTSISCKTLLEQLVELHDLRLKTLRFADAIDGLACHGPLRPEEARGLSDEVAKLSNINLDVYGKPTNPDPTGYRTGVPPCEHLQEVLKKTAREAREAVSKVSVRECEDINTVRHHNDCMRGAVMIAYPGNEGLPTWDITRQIIEDKEELEGRNEGAEVLFSPESVCMWWAGKELYTDKCLHEFIGKNEKTKIVVRLQQRGGGAPVREQRIDNDTHKAMLSYYYKKEKEQKELDENDDDEYMSMPWADPKGLKHALQGRGGNNNIRWKMN